MGRRKGQVTVADTITDRPDHPWAGDDEGHNCEGCPDGNIWRCDAPAHPMHPDLREAFRRYNVGPDWTRAEVLRMVQRLTKEQG